MGIDHTSLRDPNLEYTFRDLSAETMELRSERSGGRDLSITDIQTVMIDGNFPWTLVRVYTDAGVSGIGESYWGAGVPELIARMKPYLVGENPLDLDRLYEHMVQRMSGEGSIAGPTVTAIAGIEIALHDIAGKVLGVPVYQLIGGKYRDSVRLYCDCHVHEEGKPAANAAEAKRVYDELGFDAMKFDLDVLSGFEKDRASRHMRTPEIQQKVAIVEQVVEEVGEHADIAFDCHWSYSAESAKRLAAALESYGVWWLEDPIPPENLAVQEEVTKSTRTPIATGENVYRKHGQRGLIERQAVDVLTPDLPKVGGIRETRKIADHAETYYIPVALHNVSSPVGTMASIQLGAAIPNLLAVEYHAYKLDWWADMVEEPIIESGYAPVPERPGLGVTVDLDVLAEHLVDGETLFDEAEA